MEPSVILLHCLKFKRTQLCQRFNVRLHWCQCSSSKLPSLLLLLRLRRNLVSVSH